MKLTKQNPRIIAAMRGLEAKLQAAAKVEEEEYDPVLAPMDTQLVPGTIYLANESVFTQQFADDPLSLYACGWRDENNIEASLDFFAPKVKVPRRFTYKEFNNLEEFLSDGANDDLRAIGGEFPLVKFTGTETHARLENRGLRIRIDLEEVANPSAVLAGGIPQYQVRVVEKLKRRSLRNSLRRAVAMLDAAASSINKTWDGSAGKDPDMDVQREITFSTTASGIRPNRVGYGDTAWDKRIMNYEAQDVPGAYESLGVLHPVKSPYGDSPNDGSPEALFGGDRQPGQSTPRRVTTLDKMRVEYHVSRERFSDRGAALAEVLGSKAYIFSAEGDTVEDASNIRRFYGNTDAGTEWRVYVQQVTAKLIDITVERYELIKLTSALGIRRLNIN